MTQIVAKGSDEIIYLEFFARDSDRQQNFVTKDLPMSILLTI